MNCDWLAVSILDIWNQKQSFLLLIHSRDEYIHVVMQYNAAKSRLGWKEVTNWSDFFRCLCHYLPEVIYFHFMLGFTDRDDKVWKEKIEKYQAKTIFFVWFCFHWFKSGMLCDAQQTDNIRFSVFTLCYEPMYNYFLFFIFFYGADAIYFPISISSFFAILLILPVEPSHRKNRQIADIHGVLYCLSVRYNMVWRWMDAYVWCMVWRNDAKNSNKKWPTEMKMKWRIKIAIVE